MNHLKCRATLIVESCTKKVDLHLRWFTAEKFQNYETVTDGCIPSKNKFKTQKNDNLRWLSPLMLISNDYTLGVLSLIVSRSYNDTWQKKLSKKLD